MEAKTQADKQRAASMACGLSVRPSTGALRMKTPFGLEPTPNYWEIVSDDYPTSGFSISGYIHDDDARVLAAARDLVEALKGVMPALRDAADTMTAHGRKASASELEANIRIARAALSKAGV